MPDRLAALALLFAAAPLAAQEPPKPLALLVAVSNYQDTGLTSLQFSVRDLQLLKVRLVDLGYDVTLLANREATRSAIEAKLASILRDRQPGQMLLLALSGHGMQSKGRDGKEDAFFCPFGCDKSEETSFVSLGELIPKLGNKGANLVLVDACRDDPKKSFSGNELQGKLPSRTAVLFSCSAGQASWETNRMFKGDAGFDERKTPGHGVFMYHVLKALESKLGDMNWNDLVTRVTDGVNDRAKEWLDDYAKQEAGKREVSLADLEFQTPHELRNMTRVPLIARAKAVPIAVSPPKEELRLDLGNGVELVLVRVPAKGKKFLMGSPADEEGRGANEPQHEVELTRDFYLGKFEVTQDQYGVFGATNNAAVKGAKHPIERVNWTECQEYCEKLSEKFKGKNYKFGLPTEAQWEFACRAGTSTPFHFGKASNGNQSNVNGSQPLGTTERGPSIGGPTTVGSYPANAFGLHDMHGNVMEWCEDCMNKYEALATNKDPVQLKDDNGNDRFRVWRGGCWAFAPLVCRSASRNQSVLDWRDSCVGFRVCLTIE